MITLREMAEIAGVSISAVSKALNNSSDINRETREKILTIAKARGYIKKQKNGFIKVTNSNRPMTIAIIYSDIVSNYYTKLLEEFDKRISEMGGIMLMSSAQFKTERIIELCNFYQNTGIVDAIILISPFNSFGQIPATNIPMIGISYPSNEYHEFDYLCVDDAIGIADGIAKLKSLGHTKIAYFGEKYTWYRQQYFENAMKACKLKVFSSLIFVSTEERFEKAGYDTATRMLKQGNIPTAIFASYDDVALGAAEVLKASGYRIPEDISICGIDYTQRQVIPGMPISSVNCHIETQVDIAINTLLRKIANDNKLTTTAVQNINLKTEFMITNSIGPARVNNC